MNQKPTPDIPERLSQGWKISVFLILLVCFSVLIWIAARAYRDAPPIPEKVIGPGGEVLFTGKDILAGQQVFLNHALMENGTIWGHGAYLGPDFSAEYLHILAGIARKQAAQEQYGIEFEKLGQIHQDSVRAWVRQILKENRYDPQSRSLRFTSSEAISYRQQTSKWAEHFSRPGKSGGLPAKYIEDPKELSQLTAFFAWTAWASAARRPGEPYSYTNNFPYDPEAGNTPTPQAFLWSGLSLITLLVGTALVLFAFGRFNYLGWKGRNEHLHPRMLGDLPTPSQKATLKYFVIAALLFLVQVLVGGAVAHYRADPSSFYGIDLARFFPSHILRTWHLQTAIFWIATSFIAGGLFLASAIGGVEPRGQAKGVHLLFWALVVVALGSFLGEMAGVTQRLGNLWFWLGHQGWEYLDLGRAWQILLVAGFGLWLFLVVRAIGPVRKDPEQSEIATLFLLAAAAIPVFYLPAMFFNSTSNFTVVDNWRFWIIHLWVEGFFELFVTVMVAVLFYKLGMVSRLTATRVIYLDAILFLGSGIIGTGHHWYWTGQSHINMALGALFSAMEVVPLTLLTLDAWDFVKLTRGKCAICGQEMAVPYKWTFYFLIAVGVWNFTGAGVFGFLINLPIINYFEVGTMLTPNHGHAALMGVFGMLALALMAFAMRQAVTEEKWKSIEKYVRVSFWGLNIGLALMVLLNLFPGGVIQLIDVLQNGYWHARSSAFLYQGTMHWIEWLRFPADLIFIFAGVLPMVIAVSLAYISMRKLSRGPKFEVGE